MTQVTFFFSYLLDEIINKQRADSVDERLEKLRAHELFIAETVGKISSYFPNKPPPTIRVCMITKWNSPKTGISSPLICVLEKNGNQIPAKMIALTAIHEITHKLLTANLPKQYFDTVHDDSVIRNHLLLYALMKKTLPSEDWLLLRKIPNERYREAIDLVNTQGCDTIIEHARQFIPR